MLNNKNLTSELVEDIYKTIEPLSDGEAIDISEYQIEVFGKAMEAALRSWANPTHRDSNFNIRMSNVGKPVRRLWFDNKYKIHILILSLVLIHRLNFFTVIY